MAARSAANPPRFPPGGDLALTAGQLRLEALRDIVKREIGRQGPGEMDLTGLCTGHAFTAGCIFIGDERGPHLLELVEIEPKEVNIDTVKVDLHAALLTLEPPRGNPGGDIPKDIEKTIRKEMKHLIKQTKKLTKKSSPLLFRTDGQIPADPDEKENAEALIAAVDGLIT